MTTPKRRVKIRMRPSSPLRLQRPQQRASPKSKRATPKRRPTTNTPARPLCEDVFTQWCAAINERGPVCDFEQLSRFPGDDSRMWTTIASPGDGHRDDADSVGPLADRTLAADGVHAAHEARRRARHLARG